MFRIRTHLTLLRTLSKNPKFWLILVVDALLITLAHYLAYAIRFETFLQGEIFRQFAGLLPLILAIKLPSFYLFGLYRGMWRYTSINDVVNVLLATLFSSALVVLVLLFTQRFIGFSRSVFLLDMIFTFGGIAGHRVLIRFLYLRRGSAHDTLTTGFQPEQRRLLVIGAGDAADRILKELRDNSLLRYRAVGIVDDDPEKTGMKLHGVPVLGLIDDLQAHVQRVKAQEILISTMVIDKTRMRRLVTLCQQTHLPFKVLPTIGELLGGGISIRSMRDISYKDLLGREEVRLEQEKIGGYLTGKTVLITGAGGSIGSELCRQILRFAPGLIILFDAGEENLYRVQMELRHEHENIATTAVLGKVQDVRLVNAIFQRHRPAVVFHTAAYKHVPLVERNPWQAVDNNIGGTQRLMEAAIVYGVERFVLVSSDKAVRPTNVMGASKRVTELLMSAYSGQCWDGRVSSPWRRILQSKGPEEEAAEVPSSHTTRFMGVRFGNVLGSSGSVLPLFKRQIEKGGPVTVTHPEVTRYFMSAEEAAQLILQSGAMGEGGEIFILRMGEPVKIVDMARELIRLTGRTPDTDIDIRYIGLRPGEKLYEELITVGEGIVPTGHEKIMVLRGQQVGSCRQLLDQLEVLQEQANTLNSRGIKETLKSIVPEYTPDYTV
ncbi:MAG: polysaccharide biosynthesis protein [Desulfobulbus sp.]|nr:polysaccharide biosynthesis protein [Desulfobulbus sp.]